MANTNYAVIPENWFIPTGGAVPSFVDSAVLHNGNISVQIPKSGALSREVIGTNPSVYVKAGDRVVFSVWMKTSPSSIADANPLSGVRLGIDMYGVGVGDRIIGIQSPDGSHWTPENGFPANQILNWVNWDKDWTKRTMDFIVPETYPSDGLVFPVGQLVKPDRVCCWVQVWSDVYGNQDDGVAWFADAELYINPTATAPSTTNMLPILVILGVIALGKR